MTTIATIYDAIITKVSGQLTTYARIPNPYSLEENPAIIIRKGYGLVIGPGTNTQRYVGCLVSWSREYTIGIICQVVNTENNASGRASSEKDLIDAHDQILRAFESDPSLAGICISAVVTDDSGIQYLPTDLGNFLAIEITLRVEYQETTT
jgi:hypothetical protein